MNASVLFEVLRKENKTKCLTCGKLLSGTNKSNIKRHYNLVHKVPIKKCVGSVAKVCSKRKTDICTDVSVEIDKNEFIKCCVGLIAAKNLPFRLFDDNDFFKKLIQPYENKFGTNINSENLVDIMTTASVNVQNILTKRLNKKLISLKIDIATATEKSILVINVQYINDFRIHVNTLGTIQLHGRHKATFIKNEILKCLRTYGIELSQVYSMTSDNGANVFKASNILEGEQEIQNCESFNSFKENENEEKLHTTLDSVLSVVRSAAHTIQLAANDVIKTIELDINDCRVVVKKLRSVIQTSDCPMEMPVLDNLTRWNSTYQMLSSLLKLKEFIDSQRSEVLDIFEEFNWEFVNAFVKAFQPLAKCTTQLQNEQYVIGDFFRDWLTCELELKDVGSTTPYAASLCEAMSIWRRKFLMKNDAFLGALYLDPRFSFEGSKILSAEQKTIAENHLVKTFDLIKAMQVSESSPSTPMTLSQSTGVNDNPASSSQSIFSRLEQHINEMMAAAPTSGEIHQTFKQKLNSFANGSKLPLDIDILYYWRTYRNDSDIKKIAEVALAVPATQVSVERAFSALSLILTKSRSNLSEKTINDLLLTKLNFELLNFNDKQLKYLQ